MGLVIGGLLCAPNGLTASQARLARVQSEGHFFSEGFLAGCGNPCWIYANYGGRIGDFEELASQVLHDDRIVIIDGDCFSACTLLADFGRPHVFITRRARMHFHRSSAESVPDQSEGIATWVNSHGGYPSYASQTFTTMTFEDAKAFWPVFGGRGTPDVISAIQGAQR